MKRIQQQPFITREYAQGARCGHIEGKGRAGQYVIGEEIELSYVAAMNQKLPNATAVSDWAAGYRYGYKRAAEGSALPLSLVNAPLPR